MLVGRGHDAIAARHAPASFEAPEFAEERGEVRQRDARRVDDREQFQVEPAPIERRAAIGDPVLAERLDDPLGATIRAAWSPRQRISAAATGYSQGADLKNFKIPGMDGKIFSLESLR